MTDIPIHPNETLMGGFVFNGVIGFAALAAAFTSCRFLTELATESSLPRVHDTRIKEASMELTNAISSALHDAFAPTVVLKETVKRIVRAELAFAEAIQLARRDQEFITGARGTEEIQRLRNDGDFK